MKKLFGEVKLTWKFLIIFSILLGIGVGIINRIPFLNNTSFQDIAIVFDMWIVLAIFVIINCKSSKEAVFKCFVFFLISQPLIYLTEVIIETIFHNADFTSLLVKYFKNYYIGAGWFRWTILTIPGSFIAYQIKKDNMLSAIILSVATVALTYFGTTELIGTFTKHFPYHLLSGILCFYFAYRLIFLILTNKKERIISIILTSLGMIVALVLNYSNKQVPMIINTPLDLDEGVIARECNSSDETIVTCKVDEEGLVTIYSSSNIGTTDLIIIDVDDNEYIYEVISTSDKFDYSKK